MAAAAQFVGTPKTWQAALSVANTALDGTGTSVDIVVAGASGSRIDRVKVKASSSTTVGMIRLFTYDGTNTYFYKDIPVSAITPSASLQSWEGEATISLDLPANWRLKASTHNAEAFKIFAHGGDY